MPFEAGAQADDGFGPATADEREARELSEQFAMVLGSPWRARVWIEISVRPMSASQFVREIGGNPRHIRRCFRQLEEWGFIELAEARHEGNRRGRADHVYRTVRRAWIDSRSSEDLPLPVREDISFNVLAAYFQQLTLAIRSGSFEAEVVRFLSCDQQHLHRGGWVQLTSALDECLDWLPTLALEASERLARTGTKPISMTVGLLGFRSPRIDPVAGQDRGSGGTSESPPLEEGPPASFLAAELAKALRNPWGERILAETTMRAVSPSNFTKEHGGELTHVGRTFRQLAEAGCIELVDERPGGRGAGPAGVEHLYRSVRRARLPAQIHAIPAMLDDEVTADEMRTYIGSVVEAVAAGTFDADTDRHVSWDIVDLDPQGWNALAERLDGIRRRVAKLGSEANAHDVEDEGGTELIPATVGLAAFRSPPLGDLPENAPKR